jgi:predicted MPP superfamily phosphohydrolase
MRFLGFLPILTVLTSAQLGLYLSLRAIFLSRPGQRRARVVFGLLLAAAGTLLAAYLYATREGVSLPPALRWLVVYPVLSWYFFSIPLSVVLGLAVSMARRWPRGVSALAVPSAEPQRAAAAAAIERGVPLPESRRVFLARSATGLLGGAAVLSGVGLAQQESAPPLTLREIFLRGLHPDLEGLTILQLSDIHAGSLIDEARMAALARRAAALAPDLVVFTGDLLDVSARAAEPFARGFAGLRGRLGTFAVLGNHDYYAGPGATIEAVRAIGGTMLINQGVRVERGSGSLFLGGVDDPIAWNLQTGRVDPEAALGKALRGEPRIMLAHRPQLFPLCASAGAQLVLSGHTHGGQFAFSPRLSVARLLTPYTMGLYRRGTSQLYVHRGIGVVAGAPLRLGSPPEVALFTLRSEGTSRFPSASKAR